MTEQAFTILNLTFLLQTFEIVGSETARGVRTLQGLVVPEESPFSPPCTPLDKIY